MYKRTFHSFSAIGAPKHSARFFAVSHRALVTTLDPSTPDPMDASYESIVVLKFATRWCKPCKSIGPPFSLLSEQYPSVSFYHVDLDHNSLFCKNFAVHTVPTLVVLRKGKIVFRITGSALEGVKVAIDKLVKGEEKSLKCSGQSYSVF